MQTLPLRHHMTLLLPDSAPGRTARLTAVFAVPLKEETAAEYAILPGLLTRGCRRYPTVAAFNLRLEDLYGAAVSGSCTRLGNDQVLIFSVSFLREEYTLSHEDLTADGTALLLDLLTDPLLTDGAFDAEAVGQEKRCLTERLKDEINNKRRYARRQCERLLCPDEAYAIDPNGTPETVNAVTPASAAKALTRLLTTARIHFIAQGIRDTEQLPALLEERFAPYSRPEPLPAVPAPAYTVKQSELTEEMDIRQAKLVLGFRIAAAEPTGDIMAARVMNALWGGCPTSLLFRHVREEQSLCYYCTSTYDRFAGVLLADSGIEAENADRVRDEVLRQLEVLRRGQFSDDELEDARRSLIQDFASIEDTPAGLDIWYAGQSIFDHYYSPEEAGQKLAAVTREDVCRAARLTTFDTFYLLRPQTGEVTA